MKVFQNIVTASVLALGLSSTAQASAPQPPTNVTAIADNGKVTVIWTAPSDTGGLPIKNYTARYDVKGPKCTVSAKRDRCTVNGVKNNRWYTFYVTAKNKDGTSAPSPDSQVVIPSGKNVNAQCGTANGLYYPDTPPSSNDLCLVGGGWPAVKGEDGIYYWSCAGFRQGKSVDCKSSGTQPPPTYKLLDIGPAGGIIFYITPDKQHGLEVAQLSLYAKEWGCSGTFLGTTGTGIGAGKENTSSILAKCSQPNIAARKANNDKLYGYEDWLIPSKEEMSRIESLGLLKGEDASREFWTSSEISTYLVTIYHRRVDRCPNGALICYYDYISKEGGKISSEYRLEAGFYYNGGYIRPIRAF